MPKMEKSERNHAKQCYDNEVEKNNASNYTFNMGIFM